MLTPPGATGTSQTPPHQQSSVLPSLNWMPEPLTYSRLMPENQTTPPALSNAATPRRYSPPFPITSDLVEFFGPPHKEWHGVKVERLAANVTANDVKTMFLFSVGFEDLRIIRNDQTTKGFYSSEAYVRFQNKEYAEEAERLLSNKDFNGTNIVVGVVLRASLSEIARMAANMEMFASDYSSQSPSSSDGLPTSASVGTLQLGEYTTTSRNMTSPVTNSHPVTNDFTDIGRNGLDLGACAFTQLLNGALRLNGNGPSSDSDIYPAISRLDRLVLNEKLNGLIGAQGYDNYPDGSGSTVHSSRGLGQFHGSLDQALEHESAIAEGFGAVGVDPMSNFSRPRRQTNPALSSNASNRFGNLPPLSTIGVNGYSQSGLTAPLTAPVGAPGLASALALNSPSNWPTSAVNKSYYPNFPVTSHPPANPADQNPPCNTLYVGNLPAQTSEDELKAMFCRQRGYKRMCFRTKPQGPMCFVEFEDTHYATKALTELYGRALSNSTKGGVRLSFSKNPLGVRSQNNPANTTTSPPGPSKGSSTMPNGVSSSSHGFASPPLRTPPGLPTPSSRQMPSLSSPSTSEPSNATPPGLFSGGAAQSLREHCSMFSHANVLGGGAQGISRMPPGIHAAGGSFYAGTTPDLRSPTDMRSPIGDMRQPGPGAIGTR